MTLNKTPAVIREGTLQADKLRFGIVCARFNDFFVARLLEGAVDTIVRHGGSADQIQVAWVPGSYEIPIVAHRLATSDEIDAVIALGVVIQGATSHAGHINACLASKLMDIAVQSDTPVINGVISADSLEQATERSGTKAGNRGSAVAATAIEMANLMRQFGA